MRLFFVSVFITFSLFSYAQTQRNERLKLFVDCSNTYCDISFIKTEINYVDFVLDFKASDVHLLITQQDNGGGGSQYQLIFFGQRQFANRTDTLRFSTNPNDTQFEKRDKLGKYIQLGLLPFLSRTGEIENLSILVKARSSDSTRRTNPTKDIWNYWVFNLNTNGSVNGDFVYKGVRYNGNITASRITDKLKVSLSLRAGKNKTTYEYQDQSGNFSKYEVKNDNYNVYHQLVKSISSHWSIGYDVTAMRSTFTNYKFRTVVNPAIEYDVFPYKAVNNKLFTIRYGFDLAHNKYIDTTLYNKVDETLFGQSLDVALTFNQKWGTVNVSSNYHNYLTNLKYYNIGLGGGLNVRVTGGLSFNMFVFGSYQRDQLYLPKGAATEQQILTRQRQLQTNYNYYTNFGISYRFGSKLNNFVNPRFNGGGNFFF
jgi:hypothetical protein